MLLGACAVFQVSGVPGSRNATARLEHRDTCGICKELNQPGVSVLMEQWSFKACGTKGYSELCSAALSFSMDNMENSCRELANVFLSALRNQTGLGTGGHVPGM